MSITGRKRSTWKRVLPSRGLVLLVLIVGAIMLSSIACSYVYGVWGAW